MHELSVVGSLIDLCEQNALDNGATKVLKVEIKVGRLSGIEPHLLEMAFNTFKEKTMCDEAELVLHVQDLVVECQACGETQTLDKNIFLCPKCNSNELKTVDGEEMYLMRLEME